MAQQSLIFENARLLKFLGYVEEHAVTGRSLMNISGLGPAELAIAERVAFERGFISTSNRGGLILTGDGREWIEGELGFLLNIRDEEECRGVA